MTRAVAILVAVSCGGCWTGAPPPAAEPAPGPPPVARRTLLARSPCEATVDHMVEVERGELANIPDFADKIDAIRDVAVASCDDTHWSPELLQCFSEITDNTALQQCQSLLTVEQSSDLVRRITEILTGLSSPPPITP